MDNLGMAGIGAGLGSMAGGIAGLFNKGKNPANAANDRLSQIPGAMGNYYAPYINAGLAGMPGLQDKYNQMTNNPSELYNKLASGYQQSPGYQFSLNQALSAGGNAAAAGGMLGTPMHQQQSMETAQGYASKDFENYLNHMLGLYGGGIQGLEGFNQRGYDASREYGQNIANVMGQQAQNDYAGQAGQNAANSANWSNIFGGAGNALASFLSGGM